MGDGGKGSSPRPFSVDQKTFGNNWDAIFGNKKTNEQPNDDSAVKENLITEEKTTNE